MKRYEDDAAVNSLEFDRHEEVLAVETFTTAIREASDIILERPAGSPLIESWDRAAAAIPGIFDRVRAVVDEENR